MQRSQNISDTVCIHLKPLRKCCHMATKTQSSYLGSNAELSASICSVYWWWNTEILFIPSETQVQRGQARLAFPGGLFPSARMARTDLFGKTREAELPSCFSLPRACGKWAKSPPSTRSSPRSRARRLPARARPSSVLLFHFKLLIFVI